MDEHKTQSHTQQPEPIDLTRLIQEFSRVGARLFWVPVLLAVLAGGLLWLRAWRSYTPLYTSQATFTIQTLGNQYDITGAEEYYDKAAAEQLANTFPYLLQSDLMQSMLRQELGVDWLDGSITAQSVENTNLFSVTVTSASAQDAYDILNAIITVYPRVANYVIGSTEMEMLAPPTVANSPYNQFQPWRTVAKGAVLGGCAGLLLLLVLAMTRRTVRTREDVKRQLNTTCLASLPAVDFKRRTGRFDHSVSIRNPKASSAFQESVRSLRIRFLRQAEQRGGKAYLVSSTLPGEGKTTVALNLAFSLSQNGARVIVVDMDLRNPSIKRQLGLTTPSKGIPELLQTHGADPVEALIPVEGTRVRLLAGDQALSNPRRLLESKRLPILIRALQDQADYILIDTPPNGLLGDSAALAELADGILYVVRAGRAQVPHILDSIQFLANSRTPLVGCVLNGAHGESGSYGYGYGYGYGGYRHGYGKYDRSEPD